MQKVRLKVSLSKSPRVRVSNSGTLGSGKTLFTGGYLPFPSQGEGGGRGPETYLKLLLHEEKTRGSGSPRRKGDKSSLLLLEGERPWWGSHIVLATP